MSGYILCQTKKAERPYFIENISTNIYSVEELCYYLYHNLYLIDKTIINEELCIWIGEELNLPGLAAKIRQFLGRDIHVDDVIYPVFKEINYLTYEELKVLNSRLVLISKESADMRQKQKGDSLMENGMYVNAIRVYQKLLERTDLEKQREGFVSDVWHNLGCAYSYLFQMEKAMECFYHAWEKTQSPKELKAYLLSYRSIRSGAEYEKELVRLDVTDEIKEDIQNALKQFAAVPEPALEEKDVDSTLAKLTAGYHRSTGS